VVCIPCKVAKAAIYIVAFAAGFLLAKVAHAEQACLPSEAVAQMLKQSHGEVPALQLIRDDGSILTLYVKPAGDRTGIETWTMVISPPAMPEIQCSTGLSGTGAARPS
jgi:hypothetical protein